MIKQIFTLLIIVVVTVLNSCNSASTSPETSQGNSLKNFSGIANQLEHAYQNGSQSALDTVFTAWQKIIPPYSAGEYTSFSDTIQQVYSIFQSFYSPTDLNRITNGAHENFEMVFRYIVVQNSLNFAVVDTIPQYYYYKGVTIWEGAIPDFRPQLNELNFPVVYLSAQADSMIYRYLYQPDGTLKQDHQQRVDFLRKAMQLTHHHWIDDYHKATMPIVSHIYMNEEFTQALVTFRVFYQFGQAYLERSNDKWTLIHSELTAIE